MSKANNIPGNENKYLERIFFYLRMGDYPTYHNHTGSWEVIYITSGEYTHIINKKERVLKARTMCVLRPEDSHSTHQNVPDSTYITCRIEEDYFMVFLNFLSREIPDKLKSSGIIEFQVSPARDKHINEIKNAYLSSSDFDYYLTCDAFLLAFTECIINHLSKEKHSPRFSDGVNAFLHLLTKPENFALSLRELISMTNYSYSHMNSIFTKEIGVSPSVYLRDKRLTYAKKLLSSTTYKHSFIAECIGFSTYPRFCTFFKKKTGLTPSQYAKRYRTD